MSINKIITKKDRHLKMATLPEKYTSWTKFWFYEYIQNKKSLRDLSKEFEIPIPTLHYKFLVKGLPLRNLSSAQKVYQKKKVNNK